MVRPPRTVDRLNSPPLPTASSPPIRRRLNQGRHPWHATNSKTPPPFMPSAKRRRGYPSETHVKRGRRFIKGGDIELTEKLGRNDPCPCGSRHRFQGMRGMTSGRYDGAERKYYFQGVRLARRWPQPNLGVTPDCPAPAAER